MKKWKILSGIVSIVLAAVVGYFGRTDMLILVSQGIMLAGGILSLIASRMKEISLRRMNTGLVAVFGLAFCVGLYNHAGLWLFAIAAVWCVICCIAACISIAIKQ